MSTHDQPQHTDAPSDLRKDVPAKPDALHNARNQGSGCLYVEQIEERGYARLVSTEPEPAFSQTCTAEKNLWAVIVAAGSGERFGDARGKQFVELAGLPLASWSILAFGAVPACAGIVVVCPPGKRKLVAQEIVSPCKLPCECVLVEGSATRQESSARGIAAIPNSAAFIAIHDAARPLVSPLQIERIYNVVRKKPELAGALAARPATDTLKLVDGNTVVGTPDRAQFWYAETPQIFRARAIREAHARSAERGYVGTDDASLVELVGGQVECVEQTQDNVKVTLPEDMIRAAAVLEARMWS